MYEEIIIKYQSVKTILIKVLHVREPTETHALYITNSITLTRSALVKSRDLAINRIVARSGDSVRGPSTQHTGTSCGGSRRQQVGVLLPLVDDGSGRRCLCTAFGAPGQAVGDKPNNVAFH